MPHIIAKSHIYIITTLLKGGRTQNVSYIFQGVFEGGLENVSLHFEGIFEDPPHKNNTWGTFGDQIYVLGGVPKNVSYILVWPPLKSSLKEVDIYTVYIKIFFPSLSLYILCIYIYLYV